MSDEKIGSPQDEPGHQWVVPTALALSAFGLVLTASTAFMEHDFWLSSVLVNLGTTLVLTFPLALLGHFLTERIKKSQQATESQISSVRHEVEDVQNDLDEFRETTSSTIAELQASYDQSVAQKITQRTADIENLKSSPTRQQLENVLEEEIRLGKISASGFIVDYYGERLFCGFKRDMWGLYGTEIRIFEYGSSIQDYVASANLSTADSLESLFTSLNFDLASANLIKPADFDIFQFFGNLTSAFSAIDNCRELHQSIDLGAAVMVPNESWTITERALVPNKSAYGPLWFSQTYVQDGGLVEHLRDKPWVDYDELWEATSWVSYLGLAPNEWINGKLR